MQQDTVRLLRECDAGITMGIESINRILKYVRNPEFRHCLIQCKHRHMNLSRKIRLQLKESGEPQKPPHRTAAAMAQMKIRMKMLYSRSDATAADLVTQGTNMGIQSLCRYLNQYRAAAEIAKDLTKELIQSEEQLVTQTRKFL